MIDKSYFYILQMNIYDSYAILKVKNFNNDTSFKDYLQLHSQINIFICQNYNQ